MRRAQAGMTLVELIVAMVIVAISIAGVFAVLDQTVAHSADPLVQKQAQALAEGLLEEIELAQFAVCNGSDPNVLVARDPVNSCTTAASSACTVPDTYGQRGEGRPYYSVKEYATAARTATAIAAVDLSGGVAGPAGYSASVTIDDSVTNLTAAGCTLRIQVSVSGPGGTSAVAEGYRTRMIPQ